MPIATYDFARTTTGDAGEVTGRVHGALEAAGFRVSLPQPGVVRGERGNIMLVTKKSMPIGIDVDVRAAEGAEVTISCHLADRSGAPFAAGMVKRRYQAHFEEVERDLDNSLGLSAGAAVDIAPVPFGGSTSAGRASGERPSGSPTGSGVDLSGLSDQANTMIAKVTETAKAAVGRSGDPWQRVEELVLVHPGGDGEGEQMATVPAGRVGGFLSVDAMVDRQPTALPDNLRAQLQTVMVGVMTSMNAAGQAEMARVRHDLTSVDVPVVEFLHLQTRIREALPVRTLQRCADCGQEKVVNPDYQALMERNRKMQALAGGVGVAFRGGSVAPFLLVGTLFRLRKTDPDFVCPRCQGMECSESIVTFCPDCGALEKGAVLRSCGRCEHNYRRDAPDEPLWHPVPASL